MPRRHRRQRAERPGPAVSGWAHTETSDDGEWLVRTVPGAQATKMYRCPGCDHEIRPGVPHVVAWPADETGSVDDRRHWHNGCWKGRGRRGPRRPR